MINIAICDDEQRHLDHTERVVKSAADHHMPQTRTFSDGQALLCAVSEEGYQPDLAILDIKMESMNGIDIAKRLNEQVPDCCIIFLTGYLTYATDVYEAEHCYFILKEELKTRIRPAIDRALSHMKDKKANRILIKTGTAVVAVSISDILFFERMGHKTRIMTAGHEYWSYERPAALLKGADCRQFIRCHQSYWVNCEKIISMEKNEFTMANGEKLPLSRTYRGDAKAAYLQQLASFAR